MQRIKRRRQNSPFPEKGNEAPNADDRKGSSQHLDPLFVHLGGELVLGHRKLAETDFGLNCHF
jgi:hypothetical protein